MHCWVSLSAFGFGCIWMALLTVATAAADSHHQQNYEYCIIGAGPSGLQLAQFMHSAGANYIVMERSAMAGSFFAKYPRHGRLISINKRWTDSQNTEYSLRHDWNSLLSADGGSSSIRLQFASYSREFFPPRQAMVAYLRDYQFFNNLTVHFNTTVTAIDKSVARSGEFVVSAAGPRGDYACQIVILATGLPNLRSGEFHGHELTIGYDQVSVNGTDFEGKRLLIIGKGNSGFELAQHVYGHTRLVHLVGRHPVRFAWSTHYIGDLRAINNQVLDTYQLKSLDGMFEFDSIRLERNSKGELCIETDDGPEPNGGHQLPMTTETPQRPHCYDMVVRATGFVWDSGPTARLNITSVLSGKYPRVGDNFESVDLPGIYFAGANTHSLDFKRSAGGFVHGFRYTARALHRMLRVLRHGERWPGIGGAVGNGGLLDAMVKRINEGSGNYQMFGFLGDIVVLSGDKSQFTLLEEVPVRLLHQLPEISGHPVLGPVLVFVFEYGRNFSGPRADTFREDRAGCDFDSASDCNFLHPVVYQYDKLPMSTASPNSEGFIMPRPDRLLHLTEDFYTNFRQPQHVMPLAAFLESFLGQPAAPLSAEHCSLRALLTGQWPIHCPESTDDAASNTGELLGVLGCWSR